MTRRVEERGASVSGTEQAVNLLLHPVSAPTVIDAIIAGRHAAAAAGVNQKRHAAPCLGLVTVLGRDENQFRGRVVVRLEVVEEAGIEGVAAGDHRLCFSERARIVRRARVDGGIQVELGQQHVRCFRRRAPIRRRALRGQLTDDVVELAHDVCVNVRARRLFGWGRPEGIVLGHQRDVSEEIDPMPVAQCPQEPSFGAVEVNVGAQRRIHLTARVELRVGTLAQELVHHHDLIKDAVVHRVDHAVARAPCPRIEVGEAGIVPADHRFIRRHLL